MECLNLPCRGRFSRHPLPDCGNEGMNMVRHAGTKQGYLI